MDEPRAIKIMSEYFSGLISHLDFIAEIIKGTSVVINGESEEEKLEDKLQRAKALFLSILSYSYGKGAKVADIIKMLKESGDAQDFFHSESLLATFLLNKHILPLSGGTVGDRKPRVGTHDDVVLLTQRDMCAVCEAVWRSILDKNRILGNVYVFSLEPYLADKSWKRHDPSSKLIKIPTRPVSGGDSRNAYIRNLLLKPQSESGAMVYEAVRDLFLTHERYLLECFESNVEKETILDKSKEIASTSKVFTNELLDVILKFTEKQIRENSEIKR